MCRAPKALWMTSTIAAASCGDAIETTRSETETLTSSDPSQPTAWPTAAAPRPLDVMAQRTDGIRNHPRPSKLVGNDDLGLPADERRGRGVVPLRSAGAEQAVVRSRAGSRRR